MTVILADKCMNKNHNVNGYPYITSSKFTRQLPCSTYGDMVVRSIAIYIVVLVYALCQPVMPYMNLLASGFIRQSLDF